jgi:uncharacterized protein (TIGR04255 family)
MLDPDRPIYPQAPLQLVAFELQFPRVPSLDTDELHSNLYERLRERLPILGPPPVLAVDVGPGGANQVAKGIRFLDRQRTKTVTVGARSLTVETSAYERYELFADLIWTVVGEVNEAVCFPGVSRIGLRYINEIAIEGVQNLDDWRPWINDNLLAGGVLSGYETLDYRAAAVVQVSERQQMAVRFGILADPVVNPTGPLRVDNSPKGLYFLLDIDSYWEPPPEELPEFHIMDVRSISEQLHQPIRETFESAIKEKLRERFTTPRQTSME